MPRRWLLVAMSAGLCAAPLLGACSDDDDDESPSEPTATLFEETISPVLTTPTS